MHVQNIEKERHLYERAASIPRNARQIRIWYHKPEIDVHGSILETMMAVAGLPKMAPDFSLPIRDEWLTPRICGIVCDARSSGKPLMIYRPIVLRKEWDGKLRNPDPVAYAELYASVREQFYTVSIASLRPNVEWIIGDDQPAEIKIHDGSLEMWEMAALFSEADMVFCNAGFAPVMAQAVGTPSITVYGGRESFRTTQRAGAHLAPSLGINPINPCDCHSHRHNCDKRIDVPPAIERMKEFIRENIAVRNDLRRHAGEARNPENVVQDG